MYPSSELYLLLPIIFKICLLYYQGSILENIFGFCIWRSLITITKFIIPSYFFLQISFSALIRWPFNVCCPGVSVISNLLPFGNVITTVLTVIVLLSTTSVFSCNTFRNCVLPDPLSPTKRIFFAGRILFMRIL